LHGISSGKREGSSDDGLIIFLSLSAFMDSRLKTPRKMPHTRRTIVVLLCLAITAGAIAQAEGGMRVSGFYQFGYYNFGDVSNGGISVEIFLNDDISLDYSFALGSNSGSGTSYHLPALIGELCEAVDMGIYFYYEELDDDLLYLSFLIPEGISYHAYPRKWLELAPFVYPLGAEYNLRDDFRSFMHLTAGLKTVFHPSGSSSVAVSTGFRKFYSTREFGQIMSVGIGWNL
jgi:hypothetical protein